MQKVIGIKRSGDKNLYYFTTDKDCAVGDKVVVDFEEFQTVATVSKADVKFDESKISELPKITRMATDADVKKCEDLQKKAKSQLVAIKKKSVELGLMMKFVDAEYSMDNSKIVIVFSSEERVDFRQFLKELASMLKTRIELKQIGQRDEVKVLGGVGPCGQPCCCARFLKDFEHVTVKMAKIQGLSLSPTKINGICGRLMCCLGYETSTYEEAIKKMPKVGSEISTPNGKGTVVYNDLLRERVSVKRQAEGDTFVVEDFDLEEILTGKKKPEKVEVVEEKPEQPEEQTPIQPKEHKKDHNQEHKKDHNKEHKKDHHKPNKPQKEVVGMVIEEAKNEKPETEDKKAGGKKHFHKKFHNKRK